MPVNGLEAVADAIMKFEGWDPHTRSYQNRNPGNLRLTVHVGAGLASYPVDDKGYTIFPDFQTGYGALLRELRSKFSGQNAHKIGPSSTVLALISVYAPLADNNPTEEYAQFVAKWVGLAMKRPITIESELCNIWMAPKNDASLRTLDASDS